MYAWSSDCCVGQAGRKGLVNLFGTLGWQGTCRQGEVPAQSYVSTACLFWSTGCITILETWRGRRGESRGMGMGQGPEPGPRPGTGDWGGRHLYWDWDWDWAWNWGMGSRKKVGSRLGGRE